MAALLFASTFLVVKGAVERVSPFTFLTGRFAIATLVLAPVALRRPATPGEVRHGIAAGLAMLGGFVLQTYGLRSTTSARSALLTYLLVIIVPLLEALTRGRRPRAVTLACALLALLGLALLTLPAGGGAGFGWGELLSIGSACCFAVHIVVLGRVAARHDPFRLTLVQLAVVTVACTGPALFTGASGLDRAVWVAALYTGAAATAVAFVLMVSAQRVVAPPRVALVLLVEPVGAAVLGVVSGEPLGWLGALGAVVILGAIVVSERVRDPRRETASAIGAA